MECAILVTGMSGVGKSTALAELSRRGFDTVDTDDGDWITVIDGEPLWREQLIDELLSRPRVRPLFVQGTVANQWRFYDRFDAVVLLSAPLEVMFQRLASRTTNPFGKSLEDREKISRDAAEFVPILRSDSTHEVDTTQPIENVIGALIAIAEGSLPSDSVNARPQTPRQHRP